MNDVSSELVKDFMAEFGLTRPVAQKAVDLFFNVSAMYPDAQAQQKFQEELQTLYVQGESWAREYVDQMLTHRMPAFRATYARAVAANTDPAAALEREHNLPVEAAADLTAALGKEAGR
jgi:hypothetical protein